MTSLVNFRIDSNLKENMEKVCSDLGMNMTTAFNIFAKTVVREQRIPFELTVGIPNDETKKAIFAHFGLPMIAEDRFLCAFTHIFAGGYAAGYYGYKWAEVMSADCYGAFEEAGLGDDGAMRRLGAKYRETVLALGGSKSALEVFREFRGRDPEISALLRQQDLL